MENPNIYTDFEGFILNGKTGTYKVYIRYRKIQDLTNQRFIETIDGYQVFTTKEPISYYIYSKSKQFLGLASLPVK